MSHEVKVEKWKEKCVWGGGGGERFKVAPQMKSGNRISEVAPPSPFEVL